MYTLITILLLCFGGAFCPAKAFAQATKSNVLPDFDYVKQSNLRLNMQNPTALSYLAVDKVSVAEMSGVFKKGGLIDYYQSDNSLTGQIKAESFYRVTPNVVMHGLVSYQYDEGKNMGGSVFINPSNTPFNIVEYTNEHRGNKQRETYHLVSGLSYQMQQGLKLGASIDYTAANFAKRKDLRHRNKLLDLIGIVGASYPLNSSLEVGTNYFYRKRVEGLYFNTYGTTDQSYVSLIDFGSFYGRTDGFTPNGDGYTSGRKERPLVDNYHGVGVQFNWQVMPKIELTNELFFKVRDGYYGIKSSSSVVYSTHRAKVKGYNGALSVKRNRLRHHFYWAIEQDKLTNYENVYNIINVVGGMSQVEYYGENQVLDQQHLHIKGNYSLYMGVNKFVPTNLFKVGVEVQNRKRTTSIYPYYRTQNLTFGTLHVGFKHNRIINSSVFSFLADAFFLSGRGNPYSDRVYAQPNEAEVAPKSTLFNLQHEHEYLTTNRFALHPAFRYTYTLSTNQQVYGQAGCRVDYAPAVSYLSNYSYRLMLLVGVGF